MQDPILRDAMLDVGLNHCLLREHVQIIVSPTVDIFDDINIEMDTNNMEKRLVQNISGDVFDMEITLATTTDPCSTSSNTPTVFNPSVASSAVSLQFPQSCKSHLVSDAVNIAKSPSLTFGTPLSVSVLNKCTDQSSCCSSLPSSSDSFKSLPAENSTFVHFLNSDKFPKKPKITRSFSYSPTCTYHKSGILFSNIKQSRKLLNDSGKYLNVSSSTNLPEQSNYNSDYHSFDISFSSSSPSSNPDKNCSFNRNKEVHTSPLLRSQSLDDILNMDEKISSVDLSTDLSQNSSACTKDNSNSNEGFLATILSNVTPLVIFTITRDVFSKQVSDQKVI